MVYILVEGKDDVHFIRYLLSTKLAIDSDLYTIEWNGSHGIASAKLLFLEEHLDRYSKIIIINDADSDLDARRDEITHALKSKDLAGEIFLFPNNKDTGELEDLLCDCIPVDKSFIATCFSGFQKCLAGNSRTTLANIPAVKSKIYTYVDVQLNKDELKKRDNPKTCSCANKKECLCRKKYCFDKDGLWNFDCDAIAPLLDFLREHVR